MIKRWLKAEPSTRRSTEKGRRRMTPVFLKRSVQGRSKTGCQLLKEVGRKKRKFEREIKSTAKGSVRNSLWVIDTSTLANAVCEADAIKVTHVTSAAKCTEQSNREPDCTSFTYTKDMVPNCYMLPTIPLSTTSCTAATNAKTFVKVETTFSCHPNDGLYHTYKLSDETIFSYRIVHTAANDATARADCEGTGGSLVKMSTMTRLTFIQNLLSTCPGGFGGDYFVGGSVPDKNGIWVWDDGEAIDSKLWAKGAPDRLSYELCVRMDPNDNWKLNDINCINKYSYICEKNLGV